MNVVPVISRRTLLAMAAAGGAAIILPPSMSFGQQDQPQQNQPQQNQPQQNQPQQNQPQQNQPQQNQPMSRAIPSTGEAMPAVGLGSWITFNVGTDPVLRDDCAAVMGAFFQAGGRMIDSSPMYGSSQEVIGYGLAKLGAPSAVFSADKVWISSASAGPGQIEESRRLWGVQHFDLLQVHNLLSWERHLETLFAMKAQRRLRYVGITTSEGRRHGEVEKIMRQHPIDFVQISYNVLDREVEDRILPLARERGIGVIVNRPFRQGALTQSLEGEPLPDWAAEIGCRTWAQALLKFILAHPAVTCAIPATTRVDHVRENLEAASGPLPDEAMRRRMIAHIEEI
jgi:diketogulonate reductase-like aldo/keto reductase